LVGGAPHPYARSPARRFCSPRSGVVATAGARDFPSLPLSRHPFGYSNVPSAYGSRWGIDSVEVLDIGTGASAKRDLVRANFAAGFVRWSRVVGSIA